MAMHLHTRDTLKMANVKLMKEYKVSLFDFSYLLSAALCDEFLPKSEYSLSKREFVSLQNTLRKTSNLLRSFNIFEDLKTLTDNKANFLEKRGSSIQKIKGKDICERTKFVLLCSKILTKKRFKPHKINYFEHKKKIVKDALSLEEEINWVDYYQLLRWFCNRLKNCSYFSYIMLNKLTQQKEIKYLKSLWEKNEENYRMKTRDALWLYRTKQKYFTGESKDLPIKIGKDFFFIEAYPIVLINFKKFSIEIGELREKGIFLKKVRFTKNKKIRSQKIMKNMKIVVPTIIFPTGEKLMVKDYSPPLYYPT